MLLSARDGWMLSSWLSEEEKLHPPNEDDDSTSLSASEQLVTANRGGPLTTEPTAALAWTTEIRWLTRLKCPLSLVLTPVRAQRRKCLIQVNSGRLIFLVRTAVSRHVEELPSG